MAVYFNSGGNAPLSIESFYAETLYIKGLYATLAALQSAHPTGTQGDAYAVGTAADNVVYIWNTSTSAWVSIGSLRGPQGLQGNGGTAGTSAYVHIKWGASATPVTLLDSPDAYIGICSTSSSTPPITYTGYQWYLWKGIQGATGPKGDTGAKGDQGNAATVQVGTVTLGATPSVTNSGTSTAAVLDFTLVGDTGAAGADGALVAVGSGFALNNGSTRPTLGNKAVDESYTTDNTKGATGDCSHAEGDNTTASGEDSHAEGYNSITGEYARAAHAEGASNVVYSQTAHVEGLSNKILGDAAHAEGSYNVASMWSGHVEGSNNFIFSGIRYNITAINNAAKTLTLDNVLNINIYDNIVLFNIQYNVSISSTIFKPSPRKIIPIGTASVSAISGNTITISNESYFDNDLDFTYAKFIIIEGTATCGHVEGNLCQASGDSSHSEGISTISSGDSAHAEGAYTLSLSDATHAEGENTLAIAAISHAEGFCNTVAMGSGHVEGKNNIVSTGFRHNVTSYGTLNKLNLDSVEDMQENDKILLYNKNNNNEIKVFAMAFVSAIVGLEITLSNITYFWPDDNHVLSETSFILDGIEAESNNCGHAEGTGCWAKADNSHAEGEETIASGVSSHAECERTTASGVSSHAEGFFTTASGDKSHAEGIFTTASGEAAHAEGLFTTASGDVQHVSGRANIIDTTSLEIVGNGTVEETGEVAVPSNARTLDQQGNGWFAGKVSAGTVESPATPTAANDLTPKQYVDALANANTAIQNMTVEASTLDTGAAATVTKTTVEGVAHLAFGLPRGATGAQGPKGDTGANAVTVQVGTVTSGATPSVTNSGTSTAAVLDFTLVKGDTGAAGADGALVAVGSGFAINNGSTRPTLGNKAVDESYTTDNTKGATGDGSHAEGEHTTASGVDAHAEGHVTIASGAMSHAEGSFTTASGTMSHAEGLLNTASGYGSHAEGEQTTASGDSAHAEGSFTDASGDYSHAEGLNTGASGEAQHVSGKANIIDTTSLEIVGNGTIDADTGEVTVRSNARTLDQQGNGWFAGKVSAGTVGSPANPTADNDLATKKYVDTLILTFSNIVVSNSIWVTDTTYTAYSFAAALSLSSVTASYVPEVNFGYNEAISGNFAPVALSGDNTITIYAEAKPTADITIPTIVCVKAVN